MVDEGTIGWLWLCQLFFFSCDKMPGIIDLKEGNF